MRADDDDAFLRLGGVLDDFDSQGSQPLADLGVVDDLAEVGHGLAGLSGRLRQLDGFLDPEAEPVFAGEEHFHEVKSNCQNPPPTVAGQPRTRTIRIAAISMTAIAIST